MALSGAHADRPGRAVRPARPRRHGVGAVARTCADTSVLRRRVRRRRRHPGATSPSDDRPMALSFLTRKPDCGLGNIRSSPADPSRNVDWVLLLAQVAAHRRSAASSCSRRRGPRSTVDPYAFVTRQVVFAIVAVGGDGDRDVGRLRVVQGAGRASCTASPSSLLVLLSCIGRRARARDRISFDLGPINFQPAELAKFTTLIALCAYLAEERSDEVSYRPVPRRADHRRRAGRADHRPARPRLGVGDRHDGDGRAARRRRQGRSTSR